MAVANAWSTDSKDAPKILQLLLEKGGKINTIQSINNISNFDPISKEIFESIKGILNSQSR